MSQLSDAKTDFHKDLDRIVDLLAVVDDVRSLGGSKLGGTYNLGDWAEAETLHKSSLSIRTDLPLVSGSLLMFVAGRFEYFVRQAIESTVDSLAEGVSRFDELPEKLRIRLKQRTFEVAQSPQKFNTEAKLAEAYVQDLVQLWTEPYDSTKIQSSLISIMETNIHSSALAELTKSVGINGVWTTMGKQATLQLALHTTEDGATTQEAKSRLDAIMKERNRLAHPTSSHTFPDANKVRESLEFLRALSSSLVDIVAVYQSSLNNGATS